MRKSIQKILVIPFVLFAVLASAGPKIDSLDLDSKITELTIFFDGAQVTREAKIKVQKGKYLYTLKRLPAELNPQSIQINNGGKGEILSVKHQLSHPKRKNATVEKFELQIEDKQYEIRSLENKITVLNTEKNILLENSNPSKGKSGRSIAEIKEMAEYYRLRLNEINIEKLGLKRQVSKLKEHIADLYVAMNKVVVDENKIYSEISFSLDAKEPITANFEISYFVASAGWEPIYDFRVKDVNEDLNLVYNANIYQSTGEDWTNVNITLSTDRPSLSNEQEDLEPWYINRPQRKVAKEKYEANLGMGVIRGEVTDANSGEPLPFVNVVLNDNGKQVLGTSTDFNGYYTLKPVRPGYYDLAFSFVGYGSQTIESIRVKENIITFQDADLAAALDLDEVEIVQYSKPLINRDASSSGASISMRGSRASSDSYYIDGVKVSGATSLPKSAVSTSYGGGSRQNNERTALQLSGFSGVENITSLEYKIDIPYSIPSDGNEYLVKIREVRVPVDYVYSAVPKMEKDVFLIAHVKDWEDLDLLSGNSSIYFKGTFTGNSYIDASSLKDTLSISLNRDKNIVVERTLLKEKTEKQLIGKSAKETFYWKITVKNNRSRESKIILEDQLPLSELKSIEVEEIELSGAEVNERTGNLKWEFSLKAGEKKTLDVVYSIKYPSYMNLTVE